MYICLSMCVHIYTCKHQSRHTYMHTCTYTYSKAVDNSQRMGREIFVSGCHINTYTYTHTYMHVHTHRHIHSAYTHIYIHIYTKNIHTYIHKHIHTYIHKHIHTYIHTHIHTYTHKQWIAVNGWEDLRERLFDLGDTDYAEYEKIEHHMVRLPVICEQRVFIRLLLFVENVTLARIIAP
jgi:hypothetical protein